MDTNPYPNGASVHWDPNGNPTMQSLRATIEPGTVQQPDGSYTYTICVLDPRPGGGVTPRKPDLVGVPKVNLRAPGEE